jgi:hypothetical protein
MCVMEPRRCAPMHGDHLWQSLGEDAAWAVRSWTEEAAYAELHVNGAALGGQVSQAALVATVNPIRRPSALGTSRGRGHSP